jgi:hypothetical protein
MQMPRILHQTPYHVRVNVILNSDPLLSAVWRIVSEKQNIYN